MATPRISLFICYGKEGGEQVAIKLRNHFSDPSLYDAFLASPKSKDLLSGQNYREILAQKLPSSDFVIVVFTPGLLDSEPAKDEISRAESLELDIIPFIEIHSRPLMKKVFRRDYWTPIEFSSENPESSFETLELTVIKRYIREKVIELSIQRRRES